MTMIYFIRHAEADNSVRDGRIRPLTGKGLSDRHLVTNFLQDKNIDAVLSSPFKRAVDTIADFAEKNGFKIEIIEDFRERKSDNDMLKDNTNFISFMERQWTDFSYTFSDGECLAEVQERNIAALNEVLNQYKNKNIVIGTHGTAVSTIINFYDNTYGFEDFMAMVNILPWVVKAGFDGINCVKMERIDLFNLRQKTNYGCREVSIYDLSKLKAHKNREIQIQIQKLTKHSENLESAATAVTVLAEKIWREHYTPIIGEAQVDYMLKKFQSAERICEDIKENNYIYFTAERIKNGEMAGYCAIQPKKDYLLLSKIYVRKHYRGKGVARSFLDEITALCRHEYGFDKIRLTVNKHNDNSIAIYHKMGFETIDSVKTDIGGGFYMDDFVMELRI
ncbi:MAG: GNAT family N-acetyltransferase [Oscillospiraceae bacterium]|nr:GNAT family N-acetyltransferase [Oscillospiraceae bacterium]